MRTEDVDLVAVKVAESLEALQPTLLVDLHGVLDELEFGVGPGRILGELAVVEVGVPGVQQPPVPYAHGDPAVPGRVSGQRNQHDLL